MCVPAGVHVSLSSCPVCVIDTMGCAICTQLVNAWSGFTWKGGRSVRQACPEVPSQEYHRLSGLHYTSSFSDAEDCCDDLSSLSTSSSSDYLETEYLDDLEA
ncbi:hypothetical protein AALO_G00162230 [Alosa alosa]|uniref:Uncharacterized protein n=1 Tax=Alosa alosa TaxID=278164 RepID=A0AAV6GAL3_9TELE|nr:hypothetical protein AALO_G00162230 [Alosa alosa]